MTAIFICCIKQNKNCLPAAFYVVKKALKIVCCRRRLTFNFRNSFTYSDLKMSRHVEVRCALVNCKYNKRSDSFKQLCTQKFIIINEQGLCTNFALKTQLKNKKSDAPNFIV
jgi:hypothetical protein